MSLRSALFVGTVMHTRIRPCRHRLRYRVFSLLLDLNETAAEGPQISASCAGRRKALSDRALAGPLLRYPLMTLRVALGINWEAQRIWWKGFHVHRYKDAASKHATTIIAGTISGHAHS